MTKQMDAFRNFANAPKSTVISKEEAGTMYLRALRPRAYLDLRYMGVTEGWRKLHHDKLNTLYPSLNFLGRGKRLFL
jgi:hypothetical protein